MINATAPVVETTKKFIIIKIPRNAFGGESKRNKFSLLESGLRESFAEARAGKLVGPFRDAKTLIRVLEKPSAKK